MSSAARQKHIRPSMINTLITRARRSVASRHTIERSINHRQSTTPSLVTHTHYHKNNHKLHKNNHKLHKDGSDFMAWRNLGTGLVRARAWETGGVTHSVKREY